ncbi:MAG: hypothetical protein V1656_02170 [Candidatus Jorgensenbacteria bacterium]
MAVILVVAELAAAVRGERFMAAPVETEHPQIQAVVEEVAQAIMGAVVVKRVRVAPQVPLVAVVVAVQTMFQELQHRAFKAVEERTARRLVEPHQTLATRIMLHRRLLVELAAAPALVESVRPGSW